MKIFFLATIMFLHSFGYEIVIDTTKKSEFQTKNIIIRDDSSSVVLDRMTGLLWQDSTEAKSIKRDFKGAKTYCENLKLAGFDDWSLPTISELESIADYSKERPAIKDGFEHVASSFYWSSSPCLETSNLAENGKARELSYKDRQYGKENQGRNAWSVSFANGSTNNQIRKTSKRNIRCVRKAY